jgi:hypothetical protein
MESALVVVVIAVTVVCAVIALFTLAGTGRTYRQIGSGGIGSDGPADRPAAGSHAERDAEIRQFLDARNVRRERRGEAALDVDAELLELSGQVVDSSLRDEVRQLVLARNARRERKGQAPLDVEAEIARQLREMN